jgi:hypothetical protein
VIYVTLPSGTEKEHQADKIRVEESGSLTLLKMQSIGNYKCPLLLETVATYAPGQWSGTRIQKDTNGNEQHD